MAYATKDGKKRYENIEHGKAYDRSHGSSNMPVAKRNPLKPDGMPGEPLGGGKGGAEPSEGAPGGGEQPIESVVQEHGPAHHTEIHAGGGEVMGGMEAGGGHHVISHHQSGHVHKSSGHDLNSAHMHSHKAMGGNGNMGHAEPDGDEGGMEAMPMHEGE